jgi:hypothetical protein
MFVIGFSKLFNQNNLADLWFMVAELSLGVLFFGAFVMVLLGLCLATPVLFCYLYWRRHREEIDL